jgi:hypothetical protein
MIDLKNIKPGDKVKSELRAISCATGEENEMVEWKHWWTVIEVDDEKVKVQDNKGEEMFFDRSGRGFMPKTNHFIYKVKTS